MNEDSRFTNSLRNSVTGIFVQVVNIILSFVTRTIFVIFLNANYLGINGLFTNVLSILSLAELGFGSAMVYSMYKPIAENNQKKIAALMNLYRKVYIIMGCIIGFIGICISPLLKYIIKDQANFDNLTLIYILFLMNTVISYFFSYKRSIITADQRDYILSKYSLYFNILKLTLQVFILITTQNYLLYLTVQLVCTFLENLVVSFKSDKLYPYLKTLKKEKLKKDDEKKIWTDVKSLAIYKVGGTMTDGTDNIIISAFVGINAIGFLSNYILITNTLSLLFSQITKSITASVGNYIAKEEKTNQENLLEVITFLNFLFYGFSFICLTTLLNPFIELWLGVNYMLDSNIVFVISLNWYILEMMNSIWTFRSTMGLFKHGKYRPIVSGILNITISILLVPLYGLIGVLIGTTITRLLTNAWFDPYIVYKHGFNKSAIRYYGKWMKYLGVSLLDILLLSSLFNLFPETTIYTFVIQIVICIVIIPLTFFIVFRKTNEFKYLIGKVKNLRGSKVKSI